MILNHSKTIRSVYIRTVHSHYGILSSSYCFNIMHYSSLFQYFLSMCYGPYSIVKFFEYLCKQGLGDELPLAGTAEIMTGDTTSNLAAGLKDALE